MATRKIVKAKRKESNSNSSNNSGGDNSSQMGQESVGEPVNEMNKEWDELISSIKKNESIPWPKLQWINSVSEAQRQQLKNEISEKTCLGVYSDECLPDNTQEKDIMTLQIGEGEFKPNRTEQNNSTFRHFISMLIKVAKISFFGPSGMDAFPTALLTAWSEFNGNRLDDLWVQYPPPWSIVSLRVTDKEAEMMIWKAVCSVASVRSLRVDNMPKFLSISNRPMLTHIERMKVTNYAADISDLLYHLGDNIQKLDIRQSNARFHLDLPGLEHFFESHPNFGRNLTSFIFMTQYGDPNGLPDSIKLFEIVCGRCAKLQFLLIFGLRNTPIDVYMDNVTKLRDMVELIFDPNTIGLTPEVADKYEPFEHVKIVKFCGTIRKNYSIEQFRNTIPRLFPNLEELTINTTVKKFRIKLKQQGKELFPRIKLLHVDFRL